MQRAARRIEPMFVERPWGRLSLEPWFPKARFTRPIGEVWYSAPGLLIKYLFTSAALSVQVHPGDAYAREHENGSGKTEMWYVLASGPDSRIALGFREPVSRDQVRRAALDGSIEQLLGWHRVCPGDTYFTPAGTVHALGGGLVVLEIQQVSDITYRLYDYGRERELHLDKALDALDYTPHPGKSNPEPMGGGGLLLARCPQFVTESWILDSPRRFPEGSILVPLEGSALLNGDPLAPGEVWRLESEADVCPEGLLRLLRAHVPES